MRLLIVANRLPWETIKNKSGMSLRPSPGGLATGLFSLTDQYEHCWVGWPGTASQQLLPNQLKKMNALYQAEHCVPVVLSKRQLKNYYYGFSNKILWPLFHHFSQMTVYSESYWREYQAVNQQFADVVAEQYRPDDVIWIHDYQLLLLPGLLRQRFPQAKIGFFLHIPFPAFEVFRELPWREAIVQGLVGADLIGMHTYDYVGNFLDSVHRLLGSDYHSNQIFYQSNNDQRVVQVDALPLGINYEHFAQATTNPSVQKEVRKISSHLGQRKLILSIDRLDYTKGVLNRLEAFAQLLKQNKEYREQVIFILVVVPSRLLVSQYQILKRQIDEAVGRINGEYGTGNWTPIWYWYRSISDDLLQALYYRTDVALITPLRDGMNLVAKEFVATKTVDQTGVLILSEMAGAAHELGESIIVNPNNLSALVSALRQAFSMPAEEQRQRISSMQKRLQRYSAKRWATDFLEQLDHVKEIQQQYTAKQLTVAQGEYLTRAYHKAKRRLLLLDYDGTLVPFVDRPELAVPSAELLELLQGLARQPRNTVVLMSGRDRKSLQQWFNDVPMHLVAEHGVWCKYPYQSDWQQAEHLSNTWKEEIRPILEYYVDRTPGSFVEEKEYALAWHYRKSNSRLAALRLSELKDTIERLLRNRDVTMMDGKKVFEIKPSVINKGMILQQWLKQEYDFILAVGDDTTDEDMFRVLPNEIYTIKVGTGLSHAKFMVESYQAVRALLKNL